MSISDDIKTVLMADAPLVALLTGGIHNKVEEIGRQLTPSAFDANKEILPCALIKIPTENQTGPFVRGARTALLIYFYQRQGYDAIDAAMALAFTDLNEKRIGSKTWNIEYVGAVREQRDQTLDCPLGSLRFSIVREL